jgi:hypothetical protein
VRVLFCDGCGAPLDAPWAELVIVCRWCGAQNLPGRAGGPVPPSVPADGRPRLNLGGRTYVVEGRLGQGDSSAVYRGRWVVRLGERVVIKVLEAPADADLLRAEWETLKALQQADVEGADHFVTRLPAPVAHGLVTSDRARPASVFGWKSGFVHTLEQVGEAHPGGVPGPVVVWMAKRLLELLGFVHRAGFVHGAVVPDHVLVHPRDHGAMLVGFTASVPWRDGGARRLPATSRRWAALYEGARQATPALDIAMACRCVRAVAGWHLPSAVRADPVERVLLAGASGRVDDAWALGGQLTAASREAYGPPAYHPLPMPGWGPMPGL